MSPRVCRSSSEPGGPRRCSGDTRAAYRRNVAAVSRLEGQISQLGPDWREARARAAAEELGWPASAVEAAGMRARAQAQAEADNRAAGEGQPEVPVASSTNTVLCKSCWQAAIVYERKSGVSRLRGYRRRHPNGADKQCGGKTRW